MGQSSTSGAEEGRNDGYLQQKNELIPQRTVTGWWMCIDDRKLNKATQKDHFPLSLIDEMLKRLANHSFCVIPHSEKEGTKPPYVCSGCSNHTYSNNMITRFHVQ
jgi:hypothetical protein